MPLAITLWVLTWLIGAMDSILASLLHALSNIVPDQSQNLLYQLAQIHGLGVLLVFLALVLTGALVSNVAGRWLVRQWDKIFANIPIVKSIYNSVKKVSDTLFSSNGNAFRKAVLIQYPREGSWTIAFQTGVPGGDVKNHLMGDYISVYVPTTPNPTSGFFLMLKREDSIELAMSVDEALKYIVSMGVVAPGANKKPDQTITLAKPSDH
jgi:uncharacterized membrane protein